MTTSEPVRREPTGRTGEDDGAEGDGSERAARVEDCNVRLHEATAVARHLMAIEREEEPAGAPGRGRVRSRLGEHLGRLGALLGGFGHDDYRAAYRTLSDDEDASPDRQ